MKKKDLRKEIINALEGKMKVEKKIHKGWEELNNLPKEKRKGLRQLFGKYQYFYKSPKGEIDLIRLVNYFQDGKDLWEIYSSERLLQDVERFRTKKEAEKRIRKLLEK